MRSPRGSACPSSTSPTRPPMRSLADGMRRVGLLGTRFTMEKRFYIERLEARGLEVLVPDVGITNLNGIIYEELCRGIVRDESRAGLCRGDRAARSTRRRSGDPRLHRDRHADRRQRLARCRSTTRPTCTPRRWSARRSRPRRRRVAAGCRCASSVNTSTIRSSSLACASVCSIAALVSSTSAALCWVISSSVRTAALTSSIDGGLLAAVAGDALHQRVGRPGRRRAWRRAWPPPRRRASSRR